LFNRKGWLQYLLFYAGPEQNEPDASGEQNNGNRGRDLDGFLFVDGGLEGADLRYFFFLVVRENWVHKSHYTQDQKDDAENDDEALHGCKPITNFDFRTRKARRHTPAKVLSRDREAEGLGTYDRLAAAAAAAFLAALAAVDALRRRLVFGGVAGASPISSAVMMLVTKSLAP
jgi:hypothetical protein